MASRIRRKRRCYWCPDSQSTFWKEAHEKVSHGRQASHKDEAIGAWCEHVMKALKKGQKGLCIIAGDISPIDVITHVPILCEEADVPYISVPSKEDLGAAGATKPPTSFTLILVGPMTGEVTAEEKEKFKEEFDEVVKEVF